MGHKKSCCPNFNDRRGQAQPVGLVAVEKELMDDLVGYEGFMSKGAVSESVKGRCASHHPQRLWDQTGPASKENECMFEHPTLERPGQMPSPQGFGAVT